MGRIPYIPSTKPPRTPTTPSPSQNNTKSRPKRIVPLIIAGIGAAVGAATAGTAFGIVTKHSLENLAQKVSDLQAANEQILQVFQDVQLDLQDHSRQTKELIITSFMDRTFDSGMVRQAQVTTLPHQPTSN